MPWKALPPLPKKWTTYNVIPLPENDELLLFNVEADRWYTLSQGRRKWKRLFAAEKAILPDDPVYWM